MNSRDKAVQLAQAEVISRTWGIARQLLAVNEVVTDDRGRIVVARVDETGEPGACFVYFPIRNEPYYFVVVVRPDDAGQLAVSGMYMEAGVRVYLAISSATLPHEEITARVGLTPTETHTIGDPITKWTPTRTYREHVWRFEPQAGIPGSVEEKLGTVLDGVDAASAQIAALRPACNVDVNVVFKGWRGDPQFGGFHVGADMVRRLAAIGVELDFDLYAFGPNTRDDDQTP